MPSPTKAVLADILTGAGLVVTGEESHAELFEAYRHLRGADKVAAVSQKGALA